MVTVLNLTKYNLTSKLKNVFGGALQGNWLS